MTVVTSMDIGERLRFVRSEIGLTLHQVEALEDSEFKASALAAYERGDRAISLLRMLRLAALYSVPPEHLLPVAGAPAAEAPVAETPVAEPSVAEAPVAEPSAAEAPPTEIDLTAAEEEDWEEERRRLGVVVDIDRLRANTADDAQALLAFALDVRQRRGSSDALVTIRSRDVDGVAVALGTSRADLLRLARSD